MIYQSSGEAWILLPSESVIPIIEQWESVIISENGEWSGKLPSLTFSIEHIYRSSNHVMLIKDLQMNFLHKFQTLLAADQFIYALDYHHDSYSFYPHMPFSLMCFDGVDHKPIDEWLVSLLPNGDDCYYVEPGFTWGLVGDRVNHTITIYGVDLIDKVKESPPALFGDPVPLKPSQRLPFARG